MKLPKTESYVRRGASKSNLSIAALLGCLIFGSTAQAQQTMSWSFYNGGAFGKTGTATNGTVIDSSSESGASGTTLGTLSAMASQSDLYIFHSGAPGTYGENTTFTSVVRLWAFNKPGETGPVSVTVTPYVVVRDWHVTPHDNYVSSAGVYFQLITSKNGVAWDIRQFQTELMGRLGDGGISVQRNDMTARTFSFNDGEQIRFDMTHQVFGSASENFWATEYSKSAAWYTVGVSANGYLSTGPRLPENPAVPVLPPIVPQTTSATFTDASHTQMTVSGIGGPTIAPLPYYVVTTTDLGQPLSAWAPYLTNTFATNGTFSFSIPVNAAEPQRFFQLKLAQ